LLQGARCEGGATDFPSVLITRRARENGEEIIASPWIEALQSFHRLAYHGDLEDNTLGQLQHLPGILSADRSMPLPHTEKPHPRTTVATGLIPTTMNASSYQQLMNCPYQFFAARCLKLSPPETVREMLEKSDYGERVHLCLQAFHSRVSELPGPFDQVITAQNRAAAIDTLTHISEKVFARDIEDNFIHRAWLKRWQELIPLYVDWQIQQNEQWRVTDTECDIRNAPLSPHCRLNGRLDRIDKCQSSLNIIDYKTGKVPSDDDVTSGEAVQLPFYALLVRQAEQDINDAEASAEVTIQKVQYLSLGSEKVETTTYIESETLQELTHLVGNRLQDLMQSVYDGSELPAWGDSDTCRVCPMQGICRKPAWDTGL
jgi:ATP-dependent helicase/nuclease subunit B